MQDRFVFPGIIGYHPLYIRYNGRTQRRDVQLQPAEMDGRGAHQPAPMERP